MEWNGLVVYPILKLQFLSFEFILVFEVLFNSKFYMIAHCTSNVTTITVASPQPFFAEPFQEGGKFNWTIMESCKEPKHYHPQKIAIAFNPYRKEVWYKINALSVYTTSPLFGYEDPKQK